jgi:hypothetical protein
VRERKRGVKIEEREKELMNLESRKERKVSRTELKKKKICYDKRGSRTLADNVNCDLNAAP